MDDLYLGRVGRYGAAFIDFYLPVLYDRGVDGATLHEA